jgi:hypothetical protein
MVSTDILVDKIVNLNYGDQKATIAFLLGYIRGIEDRLGKVQKALTGVRDKTLWMIGVAL